MSVRDICVFNINQAFEKATTFWPNLVEQNEVVMNDLFAHPLRGVARFHSRAGPAREHLESADRQCKRLSGAQVTRDVEMAVFRRADRESLARGGGLTFAGQDGREDLRTVDGLTRDKLILKGAVAGNRCVPGAAGAASITSGRFAGFPSVRPAGAIACARPDPDWFGAGVWFGARGRSRAG